MRKVLLATTALVAVGGVLLLLLTFLSAVPLLTPMFRSAQALPVTLTLTQQQLISTSTVDSSRQWYDHYG